MYELAAIYKIGKTAAANISKNEKKTRQQHEIFIRLVRLARSLENNIFREERRIIGETWDVSAETVTSWMERINELIEG